MRLIGQPKMYLVKILENGVIINAMEIPSSNYNSAYNRGIQFAMQNYLYSIDEFEVIVKQL
jgi:hypothetical protein